MLNNEKIVLMTKLAIYEQGEGKRQLPIGKYYKSDYIGMKLLASFIYANVGLLLCFALWVGLKGEYLIKQLTEGNYMPVIKELGIVYIVVVVVYMFISYVFYTYKFKSARRSLKNYNSQLKQLHKLQDKELESVTETELHLENVELEGEPKK